MNRMLGEEEEEVELGGWGAGVQPDSAGRVGGEAQLFLHSTPTCIMHITKKKLPKPKEEAINGRCQGRHGRRCIFAISNMDGQEV